MHHKLNDDVVRGVRVLCVCNGSTLEVAHKMWMWQVRNSDRRNIICYHLWKCNPCTRLNEERLSPSRLTPTFDDATGCVRSLPSTRFSVSRYPAFKGGELFSASLLLRIRFNKRKWPKPIESSHQRIFQTISSTKLWRTEAFPMESIHPLVWTKFVRRS